MFKATFLCLLSIAQLFNPGFISATPQPAAFNMTDAQIARVENEVLSGRITNDADVLALAIAEATGAKEIDSSLPAADTDGRLHITQILSTTPNENDTITKEVACSTLVVVDEEGNEIQSEQIINYNTSKDGSVPGYEVYAIHTAYLQFKVDSYDTITAAKVNYMTTKLTYGTALKASKLVQVYCESPEPFGASYTERSKTVNSPSAGTLYQYNPSAPFCKTGLYSTYIGANAEVYCGDKVTVITIRYNLD